MRYSNIVILAAVALAACSPKNDEAKKADGAVTAAAPVGEPGTPMNPKQKPGLWEQTMTVEGAPAMNVKICMDEALAAKATAMGAQMKQDQCSKNKMERNLDGSWTIESTCNMGTGGTVTAKGVARGDFSSAYKMEMESTTTGAQVAQMNRTSKMTMDAKWVGPCPEGMNPGAMDMGGMIIDPSGMKGMPGAPK